MASSKQTLKLYQYSDKELLALAGDLEDRDGNIDSQQVALSIWPSYAHEGPSARMSVAQRFSFFKKHGLMEKVDTGLWKLTDRGKHAINGKLTRRFEDELMSMGEEKFMELGYLVGDRYLVANDSYATLLRRSFQYSHENRRRNR